MRKHFLIMKCRMPIFYSVEIPYGRTAVSAEFEFDPAISEYQGCENKVLVMDWCDGEWHLYDTEKTEVFRYDDGAVYKISFDTDALYQGNAGFGVITLYPAGDGELETDSEADNKASEDPAAEDTLPADENESSAYEEEDSDITAETEDTDPETEAEEEDTESVAAEETEADGSESVVEDVAQRDDSGSVTEEESQEEETEVTAEGESEEGSESAEDEELSEEESEIVPDSEAALGTEKPEAKEEMLHETFNGVAGSHTVTVPGADYKLHVTYGENAGIPAEAEFTAIPVNDGEYGSQAVEMVENKADEEGSANLIGLVDLVVSVDGNVIAPAGPVEVTVEFPEEIPDNEKIYAVHFPGTGEQPADEEDKSEHAYNAAAMQEETDQEDDLGLDDNSGAEEVESTVIDDNSNDADGDSAAVDDSSVVVDGNSAVIDVNNTAVDGNIAAYESADAAPEETGLSASEAEPFDELTYITDTYTDLVPSEPFAVSDDMTDTGWLSNISDESNQDIILPENEEPVQETVPEILETETIGPEASFTVNSLSYIAIVSYTVDFHWEVNGRLYDFSIPGGGFISLEHLVEVLGIATDDKNNDEADNAEFTDENTEEYSETAELTEAAENEETTENEETAKDNSASYDEAIKLNEIEVSEATRRFVADVESVEFSTPDLVDVSKMESDTTVGRIKENRGLECEYSAKLTEEQIEAINAQVVEAGDWALISLQPFTSEETLTVTMNNGDQFVVKVMDAQISTLFLSASGELYEVTVTYDDDAQIPEGSRLVVTEYDSTSEEYLSAWNSVTGKREDSAAEIETVEDTTSEIQSGSFSLAVSNPGENVKEAEGAIIIAENVVPYTFGMAAFDLSIYDSEGNLVEPKAAVEVSILVKELPADVETGVLESSLAVQHLDKRTGELNVETVASVEADLPGEIEVLEDSITADFTVESFSTYTITWGGGITGNQIQSTSTGDYIIYSQDANDGNYYALVPSTDTNTDLASVQLTYNNGMISYSGSTNLFWHVAVNGSGDSRTFTVSYKSGNNTYYVYPRNANLNDGYTSNLRLRTNSYSWSNWSNRIYCAGDTFLRSYNGTFQVWNQNSGNWMNMTNIFFATPANVKTVTVHYGYMSGDTFVEFEDLPEGAQTSYGSPEMVGDQLNLRYDIPGMDYVTTRINNSTNGTQISPLLQTEDNSAAYWKYRILDTLTVNDGINAWQAFGTNDNDIYVIYRDTPTEKSYDDGGLTPDDLAAPATNKEVQPNGDGTYDVSLSVTGTSNSKQNKTHANVVIVLDTSSSMSRTDIETTGETIPNGENRVIVAKRAINTLARQLFGFNSTEDPAAVEVAFVDFSHRVRNEMTKDTIYNGVVNGSGYNSFIALVNGLNTNGGTNYDTAIEAANSVLWNDADPVYVIFVTDGDTVSRGYLEYDASGATDHAADWDGGTYYTHDPNKTSDEEVYERARSAAKIQLNKLLANSNNKFYYIGVFGTVSYLQDLGGTYLGQANDQEAIEEAFSTIIGDLALELGYKDVTIHDGITALTSTALVNGVADQFRYKITKKDGTVQTFNSDATLQAAYPGIGTATYTTNGSEKAVQWNLGADYQLEDGFTYQLTFTVWPSQEAYDYLADFNNRVKNITEQDASVKKQFFVEVDGIIYQYVENKGWTTDIPAKEGTNYITDAAMQSLINAATSLKHYIRTNTSASVDYTSVKTENGTVTETKTVIGAEIRDPNGKMVLDGTALKMQKAWNDSLATSELLELLTKYLNAARTDTTYSVTLHMWQDKDTAGEKEITTSTSNNGFVIKPTVTIVDGKVTAATWPTLDVSISPGVMVESTAEKEQIYRDTTKFPRVKYGTKTYIILETGHSYNITEDDIDLHFELNADVYHPMVVNGVLKTVKFGTDASGNRIITEMSADNTALTTLTATNDLKGGLDVMKFVTTKDDASDTVTTDETYFTFKIRLQKSETDTTPVYTTEDQFNHDAAGNRTGTISGSLGFRIFAAPVIPADATNVADDKSSYEFDGLTYSANRDSEGEIYSYTARGNIPESGELTLKIRQSMLGGTETNRLDRIRIVNVPSGIYYTVKEINVPVGYTQVKSENTSGTTQANTQPTAKFWNKRTSFPIDLLKIDELDETKTLSDAEFSLFKEDGSTPATDADGNTIGTIKTDSDGKANIGKLLPGTYKLVETAAPKGYILMPSPVTIIVTSEKVTYQQGTKQPADAEKSSDGLTWTITATNNPGVELPSTGGPGTTSIYLLGTLLTGIASAGLMMRKRRKTV